ncbi:MAG: 50S ribosomal protein L25 [Rhodothermaceae bacterium TMED105]|nr:MAG: 50S ribosomal protein L25 [Rhodothermaceae bacterium TMED105]|tara:strand:- start:435 stop:1106 length:672 start_codon:yes stop_codon:yes gene_type:complete
MTPPEVTKIEGIKRELGRKSASDLRASRRVPAVLYGPNVTDNIHFSVEEIALEKILSVPTTKLQDITIDGQNYRTLLKNVEFDPITDKPLHADFYVLSDSHPVSLKVPIRLIGTPRGVLEGGGRMFQPLKIMRIKVLPDKIPADFSLDVSHLKIGDALRVSDVDMDGIIPLDASSRTIVVIKPPKGALVEETPELEEGDEGETSDASASGSGDDGSSEESNES